MRLAEPRQVLGRLTITYFHDGSCFGSDPVATLAEPKPTEASILGVVCDSPEAKTSRKCWATFRANGLAKSESTAREGAWIRYLDRHWPGFHRSDWPVPRISAVLGRMGAASAGGHLDIAHDGAVGRGGKGFTARYTATIALYGLLGCTASSTSLRRTCA